MATVMRADVTSYMNVGLYVLLKVTLYIENQWHDVSSRKFHHQCIEKGASSIEN